MDLPAGLLSLVQTHLHNIGDSTPITDLIPTLDGHNAKSVRISTAEQRYFLKWKPDAPAGQFTTERRGIEQIGAIGHARVPRCIAACDAANGLPAFMLQEWVETIPREKHDVLGS